jgi:hypothetical protein
MKHVAARFGYSGCTLEGSKVAFFVAILLASLLALSGFRISADQTVGAVPVLILIG